MSQTVQKSFIPRTLDQPSTVFPFKQETCQASVRIGVPLFKSGIQYPVDHFEILERTPEHDSLSRRSTASQPTTKSQMARAIDLDYSRMEGAPLSPSVLAVELKAEKQTLDHSAASDQFFSKSAVRSITQEQLINEVKGIYAGLVMVERKCVDIINPQTHSTKGLNDQQWKALVALHRTLLQEHRDFFSASQHPSGSNNLKKLATEYAMPARMWRHGTHAFLEPLPLRLPGNLEHMLSFMYLAYSMMVLLSETVPNFVETWIECLGDLGGLGRYRMATGDGYLTNHKTRSNMATLSLYELADKSPSLGRIQHHLAILARPNMIERVFHHTKVLTLSTWPYRIIASRTSFGEVKNLPKPNRYSTANVTLIWTKSALKTQFCNASKSIKQWQISCSESITRAFNFVRQVVNSSQVGRAMSKIDARLIGLGVFVLLNDTVHAVELGADLNSKNETNVDKNYSTLAQDILSWVICGIWTILIPILATRFSFKNASTTSSVTALMSALAVSATAGQHFPNPLATSFAGISLGSSLWLAIMTRRYRDTMMTAFVRYLAPLVFIYSSLQASVPGELGETSGISPSLPFFSVFGSVGINALVNEKVGELRHFLQYMWEHFQRYDGVDSGSNV